MREVITQQVVIREIITVTDAHSVHVLTHSVLIAATEAAVITRVVSAQKASALACRAQMVNIHSSVVAISHVAAKVVHRVVAIITIVPVVISHVSRQVVIVHATTTIITMLKAVTSHVSRAVTRIVSRAVVTTTTVVAATTTTVVVATIATIVAVVTTTTVAATTTTVVATTTIVAAAIVSTLLAMIQMQSIA